MAEPSPPHPQNPPYEPHPYGWPPPGWPGYPPVQPATEQQATAPSPYADPWARHTSAQPPGYPPYGQPYPPPYSYPPQQAQPERPQAVELPPSTMVWSIISFVAVLCSVNPIGWVLAGVSIYYSTQAPKLFSAGQREQAQEAAKKAKLYAIAAPVVGIVTGCCVGAILAAASGGGAS
ncbi:CD225/dispanin family protein [Segniliparus rugosus]|uniref:Interferon-induced transmembrane protein n=1 Tax=Segniliparus rugosus (strain ATCC BAA-974 / DSM 45345 / CCUG 50838 / CIP 108380 / JCM 13579 / CDC 945) TaxID=679197 RepID=E5XKQ2_SEGRC|nr:CD225/dispanin family protein [Segniliparus rugosus]EFV15068.1 hypothetical protein HMPREF9336_00071 [Segniliparus rugosus ATCC BAA-974]